MTTTLTKPTATILLLALLLLVVGVGCNTAHGFGKDVEKAGEGIQRNSK